MFIRKRSACFSLIFIPDKFFIIAVRYVWQIVSKLSYIVSSLFQQSRLHPVRTRVELQVPPDPLCWPLKITLFPMYACFSYWCCHCRLCVCSCYEVWQEKCNNSGCGANLIIHYYALNLKELHPVNIYSMLAMCQVLFWCLTLFINKDNKSIKVD